MAETLLQVYADIARHVGEDPTITAFAETDRSSNLVQFIWEAYRIMRRKLPQDQGFFQGTGTLSLVASTRAYALASDAQPHGVYNYSVENETDNDKFLKAATKQYIIKQYPKWDEDTGVPVYFYFDAGNMGFYPTPDASYTVKYIYEKEITESTTTTTTFLVPDDWLDFIKKYAEFLFRKDTGFGDYETCRAEAMDILHQIYIQEWRKNPSSMRAPAHGRRRDDNVNGFI